MAIYYETRTLSECEVLFEKKVLPEYLKHKKSECFFGISMNENKQLLAAVAFSKSLNPKEIYLEYICVAPHLRGNGFARDLFQNYAEEFAKMKIRKIRCRYCDKEEQFISMYRFLVALGFGTVEELAHVLVYEQGSFRKSQVMKLLEKEPKICSRICKIESYEDRKLKNLLAQHEQTGFYISKEKFDPNLCRFYIEQNEIRAAICLGRTVDNDLISYRLYSSHELSSQVIIPYMLAHMVQDISVQAQDGKNVYMNIYKQNMYEAAWKLFDEPKDEYLIQEFVYDLTEQ